MAFTEDIQGATQSGKPAFEGGKTTVNGKEETVPMDDTVPATFEDGSTTKVVPNEGTYTVAPDGTVTFVPEKTFSGKGTTLTVIRKDKTEHQLVENTQRSFTSNPTDGMSSLQISKVKNNMENLSSKVEQ